MLILLEDYGLPLLPFAVSVYYGRNWQYLVKKRQLLAAEFFLMWAVRYDWSNYRGGGFLVISMLSLLQLCSTVTTFIAAYSSKQPHLMIRGNFKMQDSNNVKYEFNQFTLHEFLVSFFLFHFDEPAIQGQLSVHKSGLRGCLSVTLITTCTVSRASPIYWLSYVWKVILFFKFFKKSSKIILKLCG